MFASDTIASERFIKNDLIVMMCVEKADFQSSVSFLRTFKALVKERDIGLSDINSS